MLCHYFSFYFCNYMCQYEVWQKYLDVGFITVKNLSDTLKLSLFFSVK